jgi:geranylgeranyl diphosphate synthase type 3
MPHSTDVLQKRPATPTMKRYTISYLRNHTKSFDYTLTVMHKLERQTRDEIARLGGNKGLEAIMNAMHVEPPPKTNGVNGVH